jgi:hypothetical protein
MGGQRRLGGEGAEWAGEPVGGDRVAAQGGEHVAAVPVAGAGGVAFRELPAAVAAERGHGRAVQGDGAGAACGLGWANDGVSTGIQVSIYGGELGVTAPYWYAGADAERLVGVLRAVASKIEQATGLTAYDPQAEAPFLGEGENDAVDMFDAARHVLTEHVEEMVADRERLVAAESSESHGPSRRWRRFFRR